MVMPSKHVNFSESLIGLGGFVLSLLKEPKTIDQIWQEYQTLNNTAVFPAYHNFDHILLGLNLLYAIGAIEIDPTGKIHHALNQA